MQKRYHSKKERSQQQHPQCIICQFKKVGIKNLVQVSSKMLIKRYYQPLYKTNKFMTINKLITSRVSSNTKVVYRQAIQISKQTEMFSKYYNFQTIVSRIKCIILQRVIKDRYSSIHFHGKAYEMTMRREFATKRLAINRSKQLKIDKNNGSGASTDSDQYSKKEKLSQFQRYEQHFNRESEATSLRRLTRNLSNMVKKFDDNLEFHPSLIFEIGDFPQGHLIDVTKIEKQDFFKNELEQNISFILSKKDNERLKTVADNSCLEFDQNYGLKIPVKMQQSRKIMRTEYQKTNSKISNSNKMSRMQLKQNISPNVRAHTDYDCQKVRRPKKNTISSKKSKQKFGGSVIGSLSKNKQKSKGLRSSKSRIKQY